ncbi:MAG: hypothetical protein MK132_20250 [Lentisphaerales bacterium]|nr:hypothetical protein [Lentisphaerales bacterium]
MEGAASITKHGHNGYYAYIVFMHDLHLKLTEKQSVILNEIMAFKGINTPQECIVNLIQTYFKSNKSHNAIIAELAQFKRESEKVEEIASLVKRLSKLLKEV